MVVGARDRDTFRVGPFTALVDPLRDSYYVSFAVPDPGTGETDALEQLEEAFRARGRIPRLEFFEDLSPRLPAVLEARGWRLTERIPILTCEPDCLRAPPSPDDLEIVEAAAEHAREHLQVQRAAFDDDDPITDAEVERWRERNADWIRLAGRRGGRIVGVASAAPPVESASELVGVATLSEHRGQGIASALTADVVARAFVAGAEVAWLTAADDAAARLYERVGFAHVGRQVSYNAGG